MKKIEIPFYKCQTINAALGEWKNSEHERGASRVTRLS